MSLIFTGLVFSSDLEICDGNLQTDKGQIHRIGSIVLPALANLPPLVPLLFLHEEVVTSSVHEPGREHISDPNP